MSAYWDSLSGAGYDGSEGGGVGDIAPTTTATDSNGGGYFSGLLQSFSALGTGYLAKRMDIDLYARAQGAMPYPGQAGVANQLYYSGKGVPMAGGPVQQQGWLNLSALMPYLLVGGAVFLIAKATK